MDRPFGRGNFRAFLYIRQNGAISLSESLAFLLYPIGEQLQRETATLGFWNLLQPAAEGPDRKTNSQSCKEAQDGKILKERQVVHAQENLPKAVHSIGQRIDV